jgi:hypothetical protein
MAMSDVLGFVALVGLIIDIGGLAAVSRFDQPL